LKRLLISILSLFVSSFSNLTAQDSLHVVSFLALGDVNLGRTVGQEILKGRIDYPFEKFKDVLARANLSFANLECPVTDQHGETQSPKSNIVFCAPPQAGKSLRQAGISAVSTANNHAYDYGLKGLKETIRFLHADSMLFAGTVSDSGNVFDPIILEKNGIKIGILAYAQFVNIKGDWVGMISLFDSIRAQKEIQLLKSKVDVVIASYHGGDEYKDVPGREALAQLRMLADFGADIVLGHHPHVPEGIERYHGSIIFHSLGNAVFNQPQKYWTQRSFGALFSFARRSDHCSLTSIELIPLRPGFQLQRNLSTADEKELMDRIQKLSTVSITYSERGYFVDLSPVQTSQ
jgi:poly-gamma-glutamate capsule biosynthesis protein CapA/YwtB (metallophosphatase superfamily)